MAEKPPLRKFLLDGDYFVGAALAAALAKLVLRLLESDAPDKEKNSVRRQWIREEDEEHCGYAFGKKWKGEKCQIFPFHF